LARHLLIAIRLFFKNELESIRQAGTFKRERVITSQQQAAINVQERKGSVLNFCANNYLGLSNEPRLIKAAKATLDTHGFGLSSVRFICGTQDIHKTLEEKISAFHGTGDTILYASCFDANAGVFEALLDENDMIFTDALNHASIIDGIRLSKAQRFIYRHLDLSHLEEGLSQSKAKIKFIVTDGVFSMDGDIAPLPQICQLADKYKAILMIDDCHATGFLGKSGKGTPELHGVEGRIDIINSTLGKALGGATGGYTTGRKEAIELLRQKSRPYLFSNSVAPSIVGASIKCFDILSTSTLLIDKLSNNTKLFRTEMKKAGFIISGHDQCPIAPVMLGDAGLATTFANKMLEQGIYVVGFSHPVVPIGKARIRVQLSSSHSQEQIQRAIKAFIDIGKSLNVI